MLVETQFRLVEGKLGLVGARLRHFRPVSAC